MRVFFSSWWDIYSLQWLFTFFLKLYRTLTIPGSLPFLTLCSGTFIGQIKIIWVSHQLWHFNNCCRFSIQRIWTPVDFDLDPRSLRAEKSFVCVCVCWGGGVQMSGNSKSAFTFSKWNKRLFSCILSFRAAPNDCCFYEKHLKRYL